MHYGQAQNPQQQGRPPAIYHQQAVAGPPAMSQPMGPNNSYSDGGAFNNSTHSYQQSSYSSQQQTTSNNFQRAVLPQTGRYNSGQVASNRQQPPPPPVSNSGYQNTSYGQGQIFMGNPAGHQQLRDHNAPMHHQPYQQSGTSSGYTHGHPTQQPHQHPCQPQPPPPQYPQPPPGALKHHQAQPTNQGPPPPHNFIPNRNYPPGGPRPPPPPLGHSHQNGLPGTAGMAQSPGGQNFAQQNAGGSGLLPPDRRQQPQVHHHHAQHSHHSPMMGSNNQRILPSHPQQSYSAGPNPSGYGAPPPQTIESIRNMYMTSNSSSVNSGGTQTMGHQGTGSQQGLPQPPPMVQHQQQYQRAPSHISSSGSFPHTPPPLNGGNCSAYSSHPSSAVGAAKPVIDPMMSDPNLINTKKRARGIGYDSNFSNLFNDKPQLDRWSQLRNSAKLPQPNTIQSTNTTQAKAVNAVANTVSTTTSQKQPVGIRQTTEYNFDTPQTNKPQMRATDFYATMADVYIQKKQTAGQYAGREKYAAGYDQNQIINQKKQQVVPRGNQIQNKKQHQHQYQKEMSSSYGGAMAATGHQSKKRRYDEITNQSLPSQISDAPAQSQHYGSSQATNSQAQRKGGKKKLKKGWHGGDSESCQNDPYGDDRFTKGKKKGKRRDHDIEDAIERGGSSQDKFESDFIDDDSIGHQQKLSSDDDDYGSHKKKKDKKDKKNKKDKKDKDKLEKQNKKKEVINLSKQDEEEEYGILSNEIDEEELQGYMDDWEKSPVKEGTRKKGSKNNTTKNSSKSKHGNKQLPRIQQSDDEQITTSVNAQAESNKAENEDADQSEEEEDVYNSLTRYVPEYKKLKLKFRIRQKNDCVYLPDDFVLPRKTFENLFDHQKQGIQWMYSLWQRQMGGVLGDDMGLGKTVQVAVFLKGLFDSEQIRKVLIVVPATMKVYWQEELLKWTADDFESPSENEEEQLNIMQFDDKKKQNRHQQMKSLRKNGGILITSYGMVTTERLNLTDMRYDVIVLDEGHKVKNKGTQFRKDITSLRVKGCRLVLTGTPLQNNLNELWSVFDFVQPKIFGNFEKFQIHYGAPIEKGLLKDSTEYEKKTSQYLSKELKIKYQDHFLRRTKKNIFSVISSEQVKRPLRISELPLKTDIVIWLPLLSTQKKIYRHILTHNQNLVDQLLQEGELRNALFILSYVKKLCLHPYLLQTTAIQKKKQIGISSPEEDQILAEQERVHKESLLNVGIQTRRGRVNKKVPEEKEKKKEIKQSEDKENQIKTLNGKLPTPEKPSPTKMAIFSILQNIQTFHNKRKIDDLINSSSKTALLFRLMQTLKDEGHRVLIFSISKKMLDLLEFIIKNNQKYSENFKYFRIDGDTEIASREQICKQFNNDKSFFCGLLTTKVGGFGLNLTGADRAIIMDPDWNPANDNQAVDRCYRIGQKRDVIVYRLVTIGGIEEMIYRRQVHKKAMNLATIEGAGKQQDHEISSSQDSDNGAENANDKNNKLSDEKAFEKYFNDSDLFRLFVFTDDDDNCTTLKMILKQNGFDYERTPTNLRHIKYLQDQDDLIKGITLNSNLYISKEDLDQYNDKNNSNRQLDVIENGLTKLQKDSNINQSLSQSRNSKSITAPSKTSRGIGYSQNSYKKLSQNSTSKSPIKTSNLLTSLSNSGGLENIGKQVALNKQQQLSQGNSQQDQIVEPADIFKALTKDQSRRIT